MKSSAELLRDKGYIRTHAIIPIKLNDYLKKCAKDNGVDAVDYIGAQLVEYNSQFFDKEKINELASLAESTLGPNWREILNASDLS